MKKVVMKRVKYGLQNNKTSVLVTVESEIDVSTVNPEYSLYCYSSQHDDCELWLVDDEETATKSLKNGEVYWCATSYDTPRHKLNKEDYTVVKITTTVEVERC